MIQRSLSLERTLLREMQRQAGSLAVVNYYKGAMPASCEFKAEGEKVESRQASEAWINLIYHGTEPELPKGADYWRLMSNDNNCVMQGTGDG